MKNSQRNPTKQCKNETKDSYEIAQIMNNYVAHNAMNLKINSTNIDNTKNIKSLKTNGALGYDKIKLFHVKKDTYFSTCIRKHD